MNPYTGYLPPYDLESANNGASSSFYPDFDFSSYQDHTKTSHLIRWNSGKRLEPRLLDTLEVFGEIYVEQHEFFNKIFHGDHDEVFRKIGHVLKKKKSMKKSGIMKRSMSMKAFTQRGIQQDYGVNEFRAERFKIRTPNVIEAEVDEQGGQVITKGSK